MNVALDSALRAAAPQALGGLHRSLGLEALLNAVLPESRPARRIGRFEVQEQLGSGSMGAVYRAQDTQLGRTVAIKLTNGRDPERGQARAAHEARALARVVHPNVVTIFELGCDEDESFMVMEYVEGTTFDHWMRSRTVCCRELLRTCIDAGRGLAAAHRAGVVHCDFKPQNVLVDTLGKARVADFGVARFSGAEPPRGVGGHTPRYAAPEVLAGAKPDELSDQYSYCRTLLELTGDCAFRPLIEPVLERGCASEPSDRWADMEALIDAMVAATAS